MTVPKAEKLASLAYQEFERLPKTGKPTASEWTILSAYLLHKEAEVETQVIAIGCGTKCVGKSKLCYHGLILNDSHAEVLARRAFLRYIYYHLKKAAESSIANDECIFLWDPENAVFRLKAQLSFHFVSTHTPCGDACISRDCSTQQGTGKSYKPAIAKRRKTDETGSDVLKFKIDDDVGHILRPVEGVIYTGAKLIGLDAEQDAMQQNIGAMRTKPGRGDRTLSMSCSDKLARWNVLGMQGALLDALLAEPIYLETLNFCGSAHNEVAIRCAIYERFIGRQFVSNKYKVQKPKIRISKDASFEYAEDVKRQNPSSTGLSWCNIDQHLKPYEVTVNGKRLGVTKKQLHTPHAALKISKYHLMAEFVKLLRLKPELMEKFNLNQDELSNLKYNQCKQLANEYQAAWTMAKQNYFQQWTHKPTGLLEFGLIAGET